MATTTRDNDESTMEINGDEYALHPPESLEYGLELADVQGDGIHRSVEFQLSYSLTDDEQSLTEQDIQQQGEDGGGGGGGSSNDEVTLEGENQRTRDEVATHLEQVASRLRSEGAFSLEIAGEEHQLEPPGSVGTGVEIEDVSSGGDVSREVEVEINYPRTEDEDPLKDGAF